MPEEHPQDVVGSASAASAVAAVVVTFRPEPESFAALLEALAPQVGSVVVVDNSPREDDSAWKILARAQLPLDRLRVVRLGDNRGIGAALNLGAEIALQDGAAFILLSDQDSLPAQGMVASLVRLSGQLLKDGRSLGAVGPTYTDIYTDRAFPFQVREDGRLLYGHSHPDKGGVVRALSLITSGTLIPAHVFNAVGPMDEGLFIDYVDVEWCLRARAQGYELFGSEAARMFQRLGEKSLRVWYLRWRNETQYPPFRIYYRVRNHIALVKLRYIPLGWKIRASWYVAGVVYSHVLFGDQRMETLAMVIKGFTHGLLGRLGRLGDS